MQIIVLKELSADEFRVALVPESVKKLVAAGSEISVEAGAGLLCQCTRYRLRTSRSDNLC